MKAEKTLGIILQTTTFKETHRIIQIFSKDFGIISLLIKNVSQKKSHLFALTTPFCLAEFIFKKTKGDIFTYVDGSVLHNHMSLRDNLEVMTAAGKCLRAIIQTQFQEKKAEEIFLLLKSYLQAFTKGYSPSHLLASFYIKLLTHEGLLHVTQKCNNCDHLATSIFQGESLCSSHTSSYGHNFSLKQLEAMQQLLYVKNFSHLQSISIDATLLEKIELLFQDLI